MVSVEVVFPCLDEVDALPWVMARVPAVARAIVVDNGSSDGSADLARALGAQVVTCGQRGYGAACHAGLFAASAPIVAFCDCDASIDPAAVEVAAALVDSGRTDLVVGRRRPGGRGCWPLHARVANRVLAMMVSRRTGVVLADLGPLRVARRQALLDLGLLDRRSGYPLETILRAAASDWRITSMDVDYLPRVGRSKVTGTVRGTVQAIRDMQGVFSS
ncbi:MAG: glycosyltransferase family 2 protein [Actinobacteria bacterium]|nr:glycosyltransferase family 2 protein [Actinomycetota bacterium]